VSRLRLPLAVAAALFRRDTARACRCAAVTSTDPRRARTVAVSFVCSGARGAPSATTATYGGPRPA
jgi:hypothetical protein